MKSGMESRGRTSLKPRRRMSIDAYTATAQRTSFEENTKS